MLLRDLMTDDQHAVILLNRSEAKAFSELFVNGPRLFAQGFVFVRATDERGVRGYALPPGLWSQNTVAKPLTPADLAVGEQG